MNFILFFRKEKKKNLIYQENIILIYRLFSILSNITLESMSLRMNYALIYNVSLRLVAVVEKTIVRCRVI
jgi:hypothetical protein